MNPTQTNPEIGSHDAFTEAQSLANAVKGSEATILAPRAGDLIGSTQAKIEDPPVGGVTPMNPETVSIDHQLQAQTPANSETAPTNSDPGFTSPTPPVAA